MRLSSNEIESRNHCTQLTVKSPPLTLNSGSVPALGDVVVDTLVVVGRWLHLLSPSTTCCCHCHIPYVT